jgi:hypothetical protein
MKRSGRRPPAWAGREGDLPTIRRLAAGDTLISQGEDSNELYLVLDGVLTVSMDGEDLAEVAPGAIVGERAALEGGMRTSTPDRRHRGEGGGRRPRGDRSRKAAAPGHRSPP